MSVPWRSLTADLRGEHGFLPLELEGSLPPGLRGTLYRVGPGLFSSFGRPYHHPLDGDGMVVGIQLAEGRAFGAVRLVHSRGLLEERRHGRPLYAAWGTPAPAVPAPMRPAPVKNAANTAAAILGGQLFALHESGLPTEIDPGTLETRGESDLGGAVPACLAAHPHRHPERPESFAFGVRYARSAYLDVLRIPDHGPARRLVSLPLLVPALVHDFAVTARHLVFVLPPLWLDPDEPAGRSFAERLRWRTGEACRVLVLPIDEPDRPVWLEAEPFFLWHVANAFEDGPALVLDVVRYGDFSTYAWMRALRDGPAPQPAPGRLARLTISPRERRARLGAAGGPGCEMPRVSPAVEGRRHRWIYACAHRTAAAELGPWDALAGIDPERGEVRWAELGAPGYPSEPIVVPSKDGEEELLLSLVLDPGADRTSLLVFDARDLSAGPRCRAHFPGPLPATLHGAWVAA